MVFKKLRKSARRVYSRARKSYSRHSKGGLTATETAIGSGIYGAARPFIAEKVPDIGMLGGYSDNLVLGGLGFLASWKGTGMIKKAGMIVLANESFIAGAKLSSGISAGGSGGVFVN
jgi:hypothetical protein